MKESFEGYDKGLEIINQTIEDYLKEKEKIMELYELAKAIKARVPDAVIRFDIYSISDSKPYTGCLKLNVKLVKHKTEIEIKTDRVTGKYHAWDEFSQFKKEQVVDYIEQKYNSTKEDNG